MKQLAIKGHKTRGNEAIEILEMLGGKNTTNLDGELDNTIYIINSSYYGEIDYMPYRTDNYTVFTLEEFLKKFPHKVGDKVCFPDDLSTPFTINKMWWDENANELLCSFIEDDIEVPVVGIRTYKEKSIDKTNKVIFEANTQSCDIMNDIIKEEDSKNSVVYDGKIKNLTLVEDLKPYKEETMESNPILQQLKEYFDNTPRDVIEKEWEELSHLNEIGPTVNEYLASVRKYRQANQYPKTYEESCAILNLPHSELTIDVPLHYSPTLIYLTKLLICRDAYWKIAGEQMGLDKPWQPDYANPDIDLYVIINIYNRLEKAKYGYGFQQCILTFPTEEMRDEFFENFKDLIERCKELL